MTQDIGILILAAGKSIRLGHPKQLISWQDSPLILHVARIAQSLNEGPVLITAHDHFNVINNLIQLPNTRVILSENAPRGQGASLKDGLYVLLCQNPSLTGVMVLLCDQPLITIQHLNKLLDLFRLNPDKCITASFNDAIGPPIIFPASLFNQLAGIPDNNGARSLLLNLDAREIITVPIPEADLDIDTPDDLLNLHHYDC
jgi:molybdenum cofactor cytidylyltransferase